MFIHHSFLCHDISKIGFNCSTFQFLNSFLTSFICHGLQEQPHTQVRRFDDRVPPALSTRSVLFMSSSFSTLYKCFVRSVCYLLYTLFILIYVCLLVLFCGCLIPVFISHCLRKYYLSDNGCPVSHPIQCDNG